MPVGPSPRLVRKNHVGFFKYGYLLIILKMNSRRNMYWYQILPKSSNKPTPAFRPSKSRSTDTRGKNWTSFGKGKSPNHGKWEKVLNCEVVAVIYKGSKIGIGWLGAAIFNHEWGDIPSSFLLSSSNAELFAQKTVLFSDEWTSRNQKAVGEL